MDIRDTLAATIDTIVAARNLHSLRADPETFANAEKFFAANSHAAPGSQLLDVRGPFVERVRPPARSKLTWTALCSELGVHDALRRAVIEILFNHDADGRLYLHQERALREACADSAGFILSVPTATGKTESFLIPILHHCLKTRRPQAPLRALVVYPTKTLEADQLNRVLRFVHAVNQYLEEEQRLRIGIWDGDTPYTLAGRGDAEADDDADWDESAELRAGDTVRGLECPRPDCRRHDAKLKAIDAVAGNLLRCDRHPNDPIDSVSYVRSALAHPAGRVDVLFTNPYALDHALVSPRSPLKRELRAGKVKYIVMDEAHVWTGTAGVAIRQLNQRLAEWFEKDGHVPRVILASATVREPARLYEDLTGLAGEAILFEPESMPAAPGGLVLPPDLRPVPLIGGAVPGVADALLLDDPAAAGGDAPGALAALGLLSRAGPAGAALTDSGRRVRDALRAATADGAALEEVVADNQGFRELWVDVLERAMPSLGSGLWPDEEGQPVSLAPRRVLLERTAAALPQGERHRAGLYLDCLLGYGRGAGIFIDRHHVFMVPPDGVFFSPDRRHLHSAAHARQAGCGAAGLPLPEVGVCSCGQPLLALTKAAHARWLDVAPFRDLLPPDHLLRQAMHDPEFPGLFWPVGHAIRWGERPFDDPALTARVRGEIRQRCPSCRRLLRTGMLSLAPSGGYRAAPGFPQPARVRVENLMNFLLSAAVEESAGRRALAIADGRNAAGEIAHNFLRDDTSRLGVAGLFVHYLLENGPTAAQVLHERLRSLPDGRIWQRIVVDVYGNEFLGNHSPIFRSARQVLADAFLDRYRRLLLDWALILPADLAEASALSDFEQLAGWHLFADTAVNRRYVKMVPVAVAPGPADGGDAEGYEDEEEDPYAGLDDEDDDDAGPAPGAVRGSRMETKGRLLASFLRRWRRTGLGEEALRGAFERVFSVLLNAGFFTAVAGDELVLLLQQSGFTPAQRLAWLERHLLRGEASAPSGAYRYGTATGAWRAVVSPSRTVCGKCGKSWFGRYPMCWYCGNTSPDRLAHHDPTRTECAGAGDRAWVILRPALRALEARGVPAEGQPGLGAVPPRGQVRTVAALRAGLPPVDRSRIEEAFRKGKLNVLAATTLMELGVDIGRLDTLLQHGVPPTFTNYVQRSGRVGRAIGRSAVVYNILRPSNPIDTYYFDDLEGRFFRDLSPIHVPSSADARAVTASQALSRLLSHLSKLNAAAGGGEYRIAYRSPATGVVMNARHALGYVRGQLADHAADTAAALGRFGLPGGTAAEVLRDLLDVGLGQGQPPRPGSHVYRVDGYLARLRAGGGQVADVAYALQQRHTYPGLLEAVGFFARYGNIGESYPVRLQLPNGHSRTETRTAEQMLRESFPGPNATTPGGFFYELTNKWRVQQVFGEELDPPRAIGYCQNMSCDYLGTSFALGRGARQAGQAGATGDACPSCQATLTKVHVGKPNECVAREVRGWLERNPRVFSYTTSLIPVDDLPPSLAWAASSTTGAVALLESARVMHVAPMFREGSSGQYLNSRLTVPAPQHGTEFCPGFLEELPAALLRLDAERFPALLPALLWSCLSAFRKAVGVLLRRDPSDFYTGWSADEDFVYFAVADTHAGGTGLSRQWHGLLASTEGAEAFRRYLRELAGCPRCDKYCHFCLLHDRIAPHVVEHLDKNLLNAGFAL